jgi:signal transduction histidine kinase
MLTSETLPMKSRTQSFLIPLVLFATIGIVLLNSMLAVSALKTLDYSQYWVEHTWQVINQVEGIMSSAKDAETGARGFLITSDPAYLDPYNSGVAALPGEFDNFARLTSDNPLQQRQLSEMRAVVAERLALLQQGIDLRRAGQSDDIHALVVSGTGKAQMDHLRSLADKMEAEEHRLLLIRTADEKRAARRARITLFVASGLDLLLIILMFRYFTRERSLRMQTEETAHNLAVSREEVERKATEIHELNITLEERVRQRTAELEATNRELEAFSYSVSHDLRAPLRTIDGFSLALEEDYTEAVDATGRDYIKRVRSGVQRMGGLIDALLQLSRITRAEITREPVDLSALAETVAGNLREEYAPSVLDLTVEPGLTVDADPKLLRVALENLLGNAAKFSSKVEHPVIHFGFDPAQQAFFVRDNGAGFDMYYADKLFNAFNRLHGDKDFKGSGIGLATVARVIRRHHGRIWADAGINRGATFFFTVG